MISVDSVLVEFVVTELPSGTLEPDLSSETVPLLLLVPRDLSIEVLSWLTAFCVAENTEEKKLEAGGCVSDPPGVFASSIAGVRGLTSPLEAAEDPFRRRTAEEGGPEADGVCASLAATGFLAEKEPIDPGLAMTGVGGVIKVVGVPTGGGVMTG